MAWYFPVCDSSLLCLFAFSASIAFSAFCRTCVSYTYHVANIGLHRRLLQSYRTHGIIFKLWLFSVAESARLLGHLINSAPNLVLPYVSPILAALVAKLRAAALVSPLLVAANKATAKSVLPVMLCLFVLVTCTL
jgi:hypothetical protein